MANKENETPRVLVYDNVLDDKPWIMGEGSIVKFQLNRDQTIAVKIQKDGTLEIHGEGHSLEIILGAANDFNVRMRT